MILLVVKDYSVLESDVAMQGVSLVYMIFVVVAGGVVVWCECVVVLLLVAVQSQTTHLTESHHLLVSQPGLLLLLLHLLPLPPLLLMLGLPDLVLGPRWSEEVVAAFQMHVACTELFLLQ